MVLFAAVISIPAVGWWRFGLNPIVAFWFAYIVTRPLGASFADWFSKPHATAASASATARSAALALIVFIALVAYVAVTKVDVQDARHAEHPELMHHEHPHLYPEPHLELDAPEID